MSSRVLFVLKRRFVPYGDPANDFPYSYQMSSGLLNSATFVKDMLIKNGIAAELVEVTDNNEIDREVTRYKPTHVIIEAYWVVPEKFKVLCELHPNVIWIIRGHSEIPFLANEGIAMEWTREYLKFKNVYVASNSEQVVEDFRNWAEILFPNRTKQDHIRSIMHLPNYYPVGKTNVPYVLDKKDTIDVACFGAFRPMKNHLIQTFAALEFARSIKKKLRFHVNASRREGGGEKPLKNVRAFFETLGPDYQLVEHEWMPHAEFKELIKQMDVGMQVSFSETFNIVTADFVDLGVPIVVSDEIKWMPSMFKADSTNTKQIVEKMAFALFWKRYMWWMDVNRPALHLYVDESEKVWTKYFKPMKLPVKPDHPKPVEKDDIRETRPVEKDNKKNSKDETKQYKKNEKPKRK